MKTKFVAATVIALAAMSSVSAFAETTSDYTPPVAATPSTLTRAEVMAEYYKARKEGELQITNDSGNAIVAKAPAASGLTREEVRKEALQAAKSKSFLDGHGAE